MLPYALIVLFAILIVAILVRLSVRTITVFQFEQALEYRRGRFTRVLGPGLYTYFSRYTTVRKLDLRATYISVPGQEVLTADGVPVKISLLASYRIGDPVAVVESTGDYLSALYAELQLALRQAVSALPVEELLAARQQLGRQTMQRVAEIAPRLGIELTGVEVKDLTFPGELKKLFAQVVRARQEGLATLEKARGETAALRHLANAAQMIERNPNLLQLRVLQTIAQNPGNTIVLGMPANGPIPLAAPGEGGRIEAGDLPHDESI